MSTATPTVDLRLREIRSTRARCAASLRMVLMGLPVAVSPQDRQRALELERQTIEQALALLLVPAVPLEPAMDKLGRQAWVAAQAALREGAELPRPERSRSVVHRKPVEEDARPVPPEAAQKALPETEVGDSAGGTSLPLNANKIGPSHLQELARANGVGPGSSPRPEPGPEPAAPELTGWRLSRFKRRPGLLTTD